MIVHGRCACDLCGQYLGQLWNEPAIAPDLLAAPDFMVCDDCWIASEPVTFTSDHAARLADLREAG